MITLRTGDTRKMTATTTATTAAVMRYFLSIGGDPFRVLLRAWGRSAELLPGQRLTGPRAARQTRLNAGLSYRPSRVLQGTGQECAKAGKSGEEAKNVALKFD